MKIKLEKPKRLGFIGYIEGNKPTNKKQKKDSKMKKIKLEAVLIEGSRIGNGKAIVRIYTHRDEAKTPTQYSLSLPLETLKALVEKIEAGEDARIGIDNAH